MNAIRHRAIVVACAAAAVLLLAGGSISLVRSTRGTGGAPVADGGDAAKAPAVDDSADGARGSVGEGMLDPPAADAAAPSVDAASTPTTTAPTSRNATAVRPNRATDTKRASSQPAPPTSGSDGSGGGDPNAFAFSAQDQLGRPARWDPCTTIRWAFNPDQAPAGALELVKQAMGRLASASGHALNYAGTTSYKPLRDGGDPPPDGVEAVVAFGNSSEYPDFGSGAFGLGGFTSSMTPEGPRIVRGGVVLNAKLVGTIADGFGRGQRRGGAVLHELGHMVGLAHVGDHDQLMLASLTPRAPADYGAGDRTGLGKVGAPAGCFATPPAATVPTTPPTTTPPPPTAPVGV